MATNVTSRIFALPVVRSEPCVITTAPTNLPPSAHQVRKVRCDGRVNGALTELLVEEFHYSLFGAFYEYLVRYSLRVGGEKVVIKHVVWTHPHASTTAPERVDLMTDKGVLVLEYAPTSQRPRFVKIAAWRGKESRLQPS